MINIQSFGNVIMPPPNTTITIPEDYRCPITHSIMCDPVLTSDGHSYERTAIKEWLKISIRSPRTNLDLKSTDVCPNHTLKSSIDEFYKTYGKDHNLEARYEPEPIQKEANPVPLVSALETLNNSGLLSNQDNFNLVAGHGASEEEQHESLTSVEEITRRYNVETDVHIIHMFFRPEASESEDSVNYPRL